MKNLVIKSIFVTLCLIPWACSRQFVSQPQANWLYTPTPTSTPIATATLTATKTMVPTNTLVNTPLPTGTSTPLPTSTATSTNTVLPTNTSVNTPLPTGTAVWTATSTTVPANTATSTSTGTSTSVWTATPSSTITPVFTATGTNTALPANTSTATTTPTMGTCGSSSDTPAQAANILSGNIFNDYLSTSSNIFFSPFSVLTAMSMAQEGANGNTACQIQTALNINSAASVRQSAFQQLISEINSSSKHYTLATANNLWPQVGFPVLSSYISVLQNDYFAGVTTVDYINNPTGALNTINSTVSQETDGYIPKLLSASNINPGTRVILTNAIYFKGTWQYQFPVSNTAPQTFTLASGATESVSMMNEWIDANLGNFNNLATVIAIPYQNSEASMYVFLPPSGGMPALQSAMTGSAISSWLASNAANMTATSYQEVHLYLPKFTFSTQYDMTVPLSIMGMPLAFTAPTPSSGADFSGIDGYHDLYITDVVHQAYVDVSESGTTAAAATGVVMGTIAIALPPPPVFDANVPFIFMIVENTSNVILFMGEVNNPLSNS